MPEEGGKDIFPAGQRPVALIERQETPKVRVLRDPQEAFAQLWAGDRLSASSGKNYKGVFFGRDSEEASDDLLPIDPTVAQRTIPALAAEQGRPFRETGIDDAIDQKIKETRAVRGEWPGQIHHERRELGQDEEANRVTRELAMKFGGTDREVTTYVSHDATPLYALLVGRYCEEVPSGKAILDETYTPKDKRSYEDKDRETIRESHLAALSWIEADIANSGMGLSAFRRNFPGDYRSKAWMDSETAYVHDVNGKAEDVNYNGPIAPIEVQCYEHDALIRASRIYEKDRPEDARRWRELAEGLAQKTLSEFWMEDKQYFAMGADLDPETGKIRKIETLSANGALLLNSDILDTLPQAEKQKYITGVVKMITSDEFITEVGVRCRAKRHADLVSYADYHGTYASWPKETYDIAKGLRKQGLHALARQFEQRVINAVERAGEYYEFFYVDRDGNVNYRPRETGLPFANGRKVLFGTNYPEEDQAWTISAYIASKHNLANMPVSAAEGTWQASLEDATLARIPNATPVIPDSDSKISNVVPFIVMKRPEQPEHLAA